MSHVFTDLRAECDALHGFLADLGDDAWRRRTPFFDWTVADEVMHLHLVDAFGLTAMAGREVFAALVAEVRAGQARGRELSQVMRDRYGSLDPAALLAAWRIGWEDLLARFAERNAGDRIPWFGPDMTVAAFAAARQMEVWAHGQDIYDLMRVRRPVRARLRNICDLGVRTQGWSFRNRGLDRPPPPRVELTGPDGALWVWNEAAEGVVAGPAEDFALVVTQRRHVDDTSLSTQGGSARRWMEIAQCFAGAPEEGPAPDVRRVVYL